MDSYRYRKIDAFTSPGSLGNPAACLYLESGQRIDDQAMLDIARQHKGFVSEVVYCQSAGGGIRLSYYSSECEVDFCGHGTIACMYTLIKETPELLDAGEIAVETNRKGPITVYNRLREQDAVFITAPAPEYIGTGVSAAEAAAALGLPSEEVSVARPLDMIDAGLRTLIVPLRTLRTTVSVFSELDVLRGFCVEKGADIVLIYCLDTENPERRAHTRVFAPKFGYLEDPATGSGNSAFGYYMLKNDLWPGDDCSLEQGGNDRVFNTVKLGMREGKVIFGGAATTRIAGKYYY